MNLGQYAKPLNATIILVLGVFVTALGDGQGINTVEWVMAGVALLRGVLVFGVRPEWGKLGVYLPLIVTALIAALTQIITSLQDGNVFSQYEVVSALVVFFTALGSTYSTPNAVLSDALKPGGKAHY